MLRGVYVYPNVRLSIGYVEAKLGLLKGSVLALLVPVYPIFTGFLV